MELHIATSKEASDYDYATFNGTRTLTLAVGTKSLVIRPGTIIGYRDGRNVVYVVTPDKGLNSEYKISEDAFDRKLAPKCDTATKAQARKAFSGNVEKPAAKVAPKPIVKSPVKKISEISERPGRITKSPKLDKTNTVTPSVKKVAHKVEAPITEKDIKAMAKKLKLPGGAGAVVNDTSYTWNKKGGAADNVMNPLRGNLKANGFTETDAKKLGIPSAGTGSYFTDGKYVVYIAAQMGANKENNWYLVTLNPVVAKSATKQVLDAHSDDVEKEIKSLAKRLKLPGGTGAKITEFGYYWSKRGGYADTMFRALYPSLEANGFKKIDSKNHDVPDGSRSTSGEFFSNGKYLVTIHSGYGGTKADNSYSISLAPVEKKA